MIRVSPISAPRNYLAQQAIEAAEAGAACLRINPGNIGSADRVREVMDFPPAPERSGVRKLGSVDSVEFRNAGFRYPGCDAGVIGVTGRFGSPMTVAVVGEVGSGRQVLAAPQHPYTQRLVSAADVPALA